MLWSLTISLCSLSSIGNLMEGSSSVIMPEFLARL
jgi:hypothetical protein